MTPDEKRAAEDAARARQERIDAALEIGGVVAQGAAWVLGIGAMGYLLTTCEMRRDGGNVPAGVPPLTESRAAPETRPAGIYGQPSGPARLAR